MYFQLSHDNKFQRLIMNYRKNNLFLIVLNLLLDKHIGSPQSYCDRKRPVVPFSFFLQTIHNFTDFHYNPLQEESSNF